MTRFLGIDHPLILVRDINEAARRYEALGFRIAPVGRHPWGTSTALAIFNGCALELMSIYDETLIDEKPIGDFRFGRTIRGHLAAREGISLLALHSENAEGDIAIVKSRGVVCQGSIEFGRDVILPDGRKDRTATTLKILYSTDLPRASNFACQQHRPDLIYVPSWLDHPNKAYGISQVTILAEKTDQPRVRARLAGLYGYTALFDFIDGFGARTGNGNFIVIDRAAAAERYGSLPPDLVFEAEPCYIAVDIRVPDVVTVIPFVEAAGADFRRAGRGLLITDAQYYGNVFLTFVAPEAPIRP
jgi:catechol 2,3-dioxygenase-like lactoylglutathione lyase family enzyme